MKKTLILLAGIALSIFVIFRLEAVPAYNLPVKVIQPDGSVLTIQLHGDEHFHFTTSADGYLIQEGTDGFHYYADMNDRVIHRSSVRVNDRGFRSATENAFLKQRTPIDLSDLTVSPSKMQKSTQSPNGSLSNETVAATGGFPTTGTPRSLVILVNFSDTVFVTPNPREAFSRLLNTPGYSENSGTGSSRDYFKQASNGKFAPNFDVVGPFNLDNGMIHYGMNDKDDNDTLPVNMIVDACRAADNGGVDFTIYDEDNDGVLDNVFVYYAGHNEAEGGGANTIWPHRWTVSLNNNYTGNPNSIKFDGKRVASYACTSELRSSRGSLMAGIGTFTHEFGHVIGLADLYHTASSTYKVTLERWDIMDVGVYLNSGRTPPTYSSFERFYLGWLNPEELNTASSHTLLPISQDSLNTDSTRRSYLLSASAHNLNGGAPEPGEYFLMEYRKKTGWDSYLPDEGLLFWHIDWDQTAWNSNTPNNYTGITQTAASHMRIYIQPLSGNTKTPGAPFKSGGFDPVSWQGVSFDRGISNILISNDSIRFDVMGGFHLPELIVGKVDDQILFPNTLPGSSSSKNLEIKGLYLTGDINASLSASGTGPFEIDQSSLTAGTVQGDSGQILTVKFQPVQAGTYTDSLTLSNGGLITPVIIKLKGNSN